MAYVRQRIAHQSGLGGQAAVETSSQALNLGDKRMSSSIDTTRSSDSPSAKERVLSIAGLPLSVKKDQATS